MARLIDAERLIDYISTSNAVSFWAKREEIKQIMDTPVVDAVEVVRCKYCKYWKTNGCHIDYKYFSETQPMDYCSYGEKKEGR